MRVLILLRSNYHYLTTPHWDLGNLDHQFIILTTSRSKPSYENQADNLSIYSVEEWKANFILAKTLSIWEIEPFDKVIALDEFDIEIAATIRAHFQLSGQSKQASQFFRDKFYMNQKITESGFPAPKTALVQNLYDILHFAEQHHYPVIIKPQSGAGTANTIKINNKNELAHILHFDFSTPYLIQNFIEGDLYHIDILVINHQIRYIKTSQYVHSTLEHFNGKSTASYQLSEEEAKPFTEYTEKLINILPISQNELMHLEVFYNGKDITFLEIASRIGGGGIRKTLTQQFNYDPIYAYLLAELAEYEQIPNFINTQNDYYGTVMVAPELGKVISLPEPNEIAELQKALTIFDLQFFAKTGAIYAHRESSVQAICRICLIGHSTQDIKEKLAYAEHYIKQHTIITPIA